MSNVDGAEEQSIGGDTQAEGNESAQPQDDAPDSESQENVEKARFGQLEEEVVPSGAAGEVNMDLILDVTLDLVLEVGRTKISVRNLLQLNQGSVVELDRLAGEPLDVLVNGTLVAHGEVVVVNDSFGIRLTDVVSPAERIKQLRQ